MRRAFALLQRLALARLEYDSVFAWILDDPTTAAIGCLPSKLEQSSVDWEAAREFTEKTSFITTSAASTKKRPKINSGHLSISEKSDRLYCY